MCSGKTVSWLIETSIKLTFSLYLLKELRNGSLFLPISKSRKTKTGFKVLPKLYYMKVVASKKDNFRFYQFDQLSAFWQQKYFAKA
jgi:hypothetical protein